MKVKIKNTIYDSENEPIMLVLSAQDRLHILAMKPSSTQFCTYPANMSYDRLEAFIDETPENPLYVEPPSVDNKELAKKLVASFNLNKTILSVTNVGCCGNTIYGVNNVAVLLRRILEETFSFTSEELDELTRGQK